MTSSRIHCLHYEFAALIGSSINIGLRTAVPRLNVANIQALPFRLRLLKNNDQIVAEIEKQLTRLEAGVAGLRRVQANLKRYRAAVLKAACEGKLVPTEAELARQEGRTYETGAQLLERISANAEEMERKREIQRAR